MNSNYVETVSDGTEETETQAPAEETAAEPAASALADARMSRQSARDEAVELLEDILEDSQADSEVKEAAIKEASVIAQNILKETNIESLVEAKGFAGCVACINADSCSVVVTGDMENEQNALIVRDIAVSETGLSPEQIRIISAS